MANCQEFGFDGESSMKGKFKRCATTLMKNCTLAYLIHSFNHILSLVLTRACDVKVEIVFQTLIYIII